MTALELAARVLTALLDAFGPALVRQKIDEWEAARAASDAAFEVKFGEKP